MLWPWFSSREVQGKNQQRLTVPLAHICWSWTHYGSSWSSQLCSLPELGQAGSGQQLRQSRAPKQLCDAHIPSAQQQKNIFKEPDDAFPALNSKTALYSAWCWILSTEVSLSQMVPPHSRRRTFSKFLHTACECITRPLDLIIKLIN